MLPHAVEGDLIDKAVVADEANDAISPLKPVYSPSEEFYVHVRQGILVRRHRVFRVGCSYAVINYLVFTILVVVVLVQLADVVGRVPNDDRYRRFLLSLDAGSVRLGHEGERGLVSLSQFKRVNEARLLPIL